MKVIDFIKRLNEIRYDENTELTFSCVDGDTGEVYWLKLDDDSKDNDCFWYGKDLSDGLSNEINISINVDSSDYFKDKLENTKMYDTLCKINDAMNEYYEYLEYQKIQKGIGSY